MDKRLSVVFKIGISVVVISSIVLILDLIEKTMNINISWERIYPELRSLYRFLSASGLMFLLINLFYSILFNKVSNGFHNYLLDYSRKSILFPYLLSTQQIDSEINKGESVYGENLDLGVAAFFSKSTKEGNTYLSVKSLLNDTKEDFLCKDISVMDCMMSLQETYNVVFYSLSGYEELKRQGYQIMLK